MRLDKYLKTTRIIKRRTVAKDASDAGIIKVNGREAKASTQLKVGDVLDIDFGGRSIRVRVLELKETTKKEEAQNLYEVLTSDENQKV